MCSPGARWPRSVSRASQFEVAQICMLLHQLICHIFKPESNQMEEEWDGGAEGGRRVRVGYDFVTKCLGKRAMERRKQREEARDVNKDCFIGCDRWRSC